MYEAYLHAFLLLFIPCFQLSLTTLAVQLSCLRIDTYWIQFLHLNLHLAKSVLAVSSGRLRYQTAAHKYCFAGKEECTECQ